MEKRAIIEEGRTPVVEQEKKAEVSVQLNKQPLEEDVNKRLADIVTKHKK